MPKSPAVQKPAEDVEHEDANRSPAAICRHVMAVLGRPADFLRITARQVSGENYRVNVVAGPDVSSSRIAHSYFITADADGNVKQSSPALVKQY